MVSFPSPSERIAALALLRLATSDISTDEIRARKINVKYSSRRSRSKRLIMSKTGWKDIKLETVWKDRMKRRRVTWSVMNGKAEAILKLLSGGGCLPEVKIRQKIGDSPDTSKALRMLLKFEKVKRVGTGGLQQPYVYTDFRWYVISAPRSESRSDFYTNEGCEVPVEEAQRVERGDENVIPTSDEEVIPTPKESQSTGSQQTKKPWNFSWEISDPFSDVDPRLYHKYFEEIPDDSSYYRW